MEELFAWHERPGAFQRLSPPFEHTEVDEPPTSLAVGTRVVLRQRLLGPIALPWVAEHVAYDPPHLFADRQASGPFAHWYHRHEFAAVDGGGSALTDNVEYRLPLGPPGAAVAGALVRRRLARLFDYRHATMRDDLAAHWRATQKGTTPMHVAVTGSTGFLGEPLVAFLQTGGHRVTRLVRGAATGPDTLAWDPARGKLDPAGLRGVDAVVHLAGENVGARRWNAAHKRRVLESRVLGTGLLARTLAGLDDGPRTLVSVSGIGYYGSRGDEILTEDSSPGDDFLADVCQQWEGAADPARQAGLRVVHPRIGIVQSPDGGQLARQLPLFKLGVGGKLGNGGHWQSWIARDDVVGILHHALTTPELSGPVNATAPQPVTNAEYTRVLARVLGRPAFATVPRLGPAVLLGREGSEAIAFASQRVLPVRAEASGYAFRNPTLEGALRHVLGRTSS